MAKIKIAGAAILTLLLVIIILQNTESVQTRLLVVTVEMPRAVLLLLSVMIGFVSGLLVAFAMSSRSKRAA